MATTRVSNRRIQMKHILIALISIVTAILFISSIVLITIGYLNPYGSVGLGILAGGCVVFFSAILFLCVSSIWIKNKFYADETDIKEKLFERSSEDLTLLKPTSHTILAEHSGVGRGKKDIQGDNNKSCPLYSVSTIYSSASSSSSIINDNLMPLKPQEDIAGALNSDVFSSSLTALQHGDMRSEERLAATKRSTELLSGGHTGQEVKDEQKRQHANKVTHNNKKYVPAHPQQHKPVVMDSAYYVPRENNDKQVVISLTDLQSAKETQSSTTKDLNDRNKPLCSVDTSKITAAAYLHNDCKANYNHKTDPAPEKGKRINAIQNIQTADRRESSVPESDPAIPKSVNKQDIRRNDLIAVLPSNLEIKDMSNKKTDKCNQDRTIKPLQGLSPQKQLDQSASVLVGSNVTRAEVSREKVPIPKKQVKPGTRTNQ